MYSEQTKELLNHLKFGKSNAIKRSQLAKELGVNDREARRRISYARLEGVCIGNEQDGNGYYLPIKSEELARQYKQTIHRARVLLAQLRGIRAEMGKDPSQMTLEDVLEKEIENAV